MLGAASLASLILAQPPTEVLQTVEMGTITLIPVESATTVMTVERNDSLLSNDNGLSIIDIS